MYMGYVSLDPDRDLQIPELTRYCAYAYAYAYAYVYVYATARANARRSAVVVASEARVAPLSRTPSAPLSCNRLSAS